MRIPVRLPSYTACEKLLYIRHYWAKIEEMNLGLVGGVCGTRILVTVTTLGAGKPKRAPAPSVVSRLLP